MYAGNYDFYLEEKELRNEIQQNAFENQQQKIRQAERFVERFKAKASKAKQAQSRAKMLDKMERIEAVADEAAAVDFKFKFKVKSGRHVVKSGEYLQVLWRPQHPFMPMRTLRRGDKVAFYRGQW